MSGERSGADAGHWSARYAAGDTPWDLGRPHPELDRRLAAGGLRPPHRGARALVPGCGRGHDALALARAGWRVTAIDVVERLADEIGPALGRFGGEFVAADALAWVPDEPVDLIFEHTFFCALDPDLRPRYGALARRALRPGGRLAAIVFPCGKPRGAGGPPHGITSEDLGAVLGERFRRLTDEKVVFRGHSAWEERWAVWQHS